MEFIKTLAETFAISLAATSAVAWIARLGGSRPDWLRMAAIAVGLTIAQALHMQWPLSILGHSLVLGACVAASVLLAQAVRRGNGREALRFIQAERNVGASAVQQAEPLRPRGGG